MALIEAKKHKSVTMEPTLDRQLTGYITAKAESEEMYIIKRRDNFALLRQQVWGYGKGIGKASGRFFTIRS